LGVSKVPIQVAQRVLEAALCRVPLTSSRFARSRL
jgi:hypothetical protein